MAMLPPVLVRLVPVAARVHRNRRRQTRPGSDTAGRGVRRCPARVSRCRTAGSLRTAARCSGPGSVRVGDQRFYSSSGGTLAVGTELLFTAMDSTAHRPEAPRCFDGGRESLGQREREPRCSVRGGDGVWNRSLIGNGMGAIPIG